MLWMATNNVQFSYNNLLLIKTDSVAMGSPLIIILIIITYFGTIKIHLHKAGTLMIFFSTF